MEIIILGIVVGLIALFLITQRWFWLWGFGLGGLASCFAMIASVIHFQILGAIGYFVLMIICWGVAGAIAE